MRTGNAIAGLVGGLTIAAMTCGGTAPALAGALFEPPAGCAVYLTTQNRGCRVVNHYSCPAVHPDHRWSHRFVPGSGAWVSRIDGDAQWVESGPEAEPDWMRTQWPVEDSGSVSELIETGVDAYDFIQRSRSGITERVSGFDKVIGEVVVDGEPLLRTQFEATYRDVNGSVTRQVRGEEYVSAKHGRFFGDRLIEMRDGREIARHSRGPVEFVYPGEEGFRSLDPQYDCDVISGMPDGARVAGVGPGASPSPLSLGPMAHQWQPPGIFLDRRNSGARGIGGPS
ncbi:hypothetical protein JYP51_16125 [Ponticoccus gilvus]|nr:hypothetical protein [Enemella evansiae]